MAATTTLDYKPVGSGPQRTFLGHPLGLYTLFFTELWERFSFYGMKALLILYMLNNFLWSQEKASELFAWYTGLVYFTPVFGGIIADKFLGARRAVLIGGILIALGHLSLAFEPLPFFYAGLGLLILGVGLLKPNVSTQVGSLYKPGDPRRDSAFTIFYMGINAGAFMGPLLCDWLRIHYGWHYGFGAAAIGMFVGLIVYVIGLRWVVEVEQDVDLEHKNATGPGGAGHISPKVQADRVLALVIICAFCILFWVCFEQMANAMTVWADQNTNLKPFDPEPDQATVEGEPTPAPPGALYFGAGQLQSINPGYILLFGAIFSWLWIWLERRGKQPSSPGKMGWAVLLTAMAWGVMILAGRSEDKPSSAPLPALPSGITLSDYGATRLSYDASQKVLRMSGVLSNLDRLNLIGKTSPDALANCVERLATRAEEQDKKPDMSAPWTVTESCAELDGSTALDSTRLPAHVSWNPTTRTLTTTAKLPEIDRLVVRAAAANPEFRDAVNSIYKQSSVFRISVWWLFLHYLLATLGELCLSPVGLSLVTKLAPPKFVGMFMGLWFLTTGAIANFVAHTIGGMWGKMKPIDYFTIFAIVSIGATVLMIALLKFLKKRMHGVR